LIRFLFFTFLLFFQEANASFNFEELNRFPRSGNLLSFIHSPMRRYKNRLEENTFFYDTGKGCLESELGLSICSKSEWIIKGRKRKDSVRLFSNNRLVQEFFHIQEGAISSLASDSDLKDFNFRIVGEKGFYEAKGLTSITFNWSKNPNSERGVLIFEPANFYLELFVVSGPSLARLRYDVRCDFCSGPDWIEAQEFSRDSLPNSIRYYSSDEPRDITPRLFDSLLQAFYFRPLSQLGAAIQKTLVEEGGFPPVQF
jgi:hypothetical protein